MESPSSQLYENMALGNAIVFIIHVAWPIFSSVLERPPLCVCVSAYTRVHVRVCERDDIDKLHFSNKVAGKYHSPKRN